MDTSANQYENIYEGLGSESFNLYQEIEKLKTDNHMLEQHVTSLEEDIEKLIKVVIDLKTTQMNLSNNISSLYRTAQAEIERKDRMIAALRHELDNVLFKRTDIKPTIKDSNLTASKKPKCDEIRPYNEWSGNKPERKDNYEDRDRSRGRGFEKTRTENGGRYEERQSRRSRDSHYKKKTRESFNEYEEKHKLSRRKHSNESIGRSDECRKAKQGYLENDLLRNQILNVEKKKFIEQKIPKKKLKFVESLEKEIKRKSLTPQNSFEEVYPEKEDLKKSKCNRSNVVFARKNEEKSTTTVEFSKHCIDKLITRESTNAMKITKDVTCEKPRFVKLESNKSENKIVNRLKLSEIEFKDKSSIYPEKSQSNMKKSSKFLRTDCFQNRNSKERDKKVVVAVIPKIEKETEASNLQSRQLGSFEFNMTSLESVSSNESNTSIVDESNIEDGEIVETSFVENLNMEDTKSRSKSSIENYSKNDRTSGFKNLEYKTGEFKSVESNKNILSATHLKKECELSCVLKTNDSINVDNIEITSERNNISLLDTVEDKVTKYSDMESILQQTSLNNFESAGNMKKMLGDNGDYVLDDQNNKPVIGDKITVLSDIVLTTNSNIVKEIDNVSSNLSEIVNVDSENQSEIEFEILGSLKDGTEEIKKLVEIDNNDSKGKMEKSTEILKDFKIRRSTRIKREVSGSKNSRESSPEKKNKQITKLQVDGIEHETTAQILNEPFDNLSDNCNQNSLAPLKTSGCKSKSVENIKETNPDTRIFLGKKKLSDQLVSSINKPNSVVKIEDTDISNRQIQSDCIDKHSSLQDYNKSSIGKLENVRDDSKSLEYLEGGNTAKLDLVIKSSSRKLDVVSCKSKLPKPELDNSKVKEGERPSDSNVLEGYQKSLLEEIENPTKELILKKLENDGCAKAKMSSTKKECNLSEDEKSSVEKLKIASYPSIPQKQIDGKVSSGNSRQSNKKSTGKLEIISMESTSLDKTEQNCVLKEKGSSVNGKKYSPDYKHSSAKLENVKRKSKSLHKMESEQTTNSEMVSDKDKHTSPEDCKNSSSEKIISKSQLLEKVEDKNVAKKTKVSFKMDKHNCKKSSEKNEKTSSIKEKKQYSNVITSSSARKSEKTRKKSKSFNKVDDENNTKKNESGYNQKMQLDICKKSSENLETAASKSQLAIGKNSDKNELVVSSSIENTISEDNKKAFPGNLEVTSSKLKYPSEILDYGNVTKRKKRSSGNSEDNSDKAQFSDKFAKNICSKRRKGQHDRVEKLPKLESKNVATEHHELSTKSVENISNESIDKLCVGESAHDTEKTCDIESEIDNDTKSDKVENVVNDMILSDKITYKQEYETAEKITSKILTEECDSATPTKPLTRRRITPTPIKNTEQVCSFANILEKNQPTTFSESSPLHLTHEGEIPILHIEENNFSTVRVEDAFKLGDSNIMKLLDTMHLSNMDSELSKFKSNTDNLDTTEPINQLENRLSFENIMDKITPIVCKSDLKKCEVTDSGQITKNTCGTVVNLSTGNRKRRRICRVIVLE